MLTLPGVLGNRGKRVFISGEQGNKGQILWGTGEQRQYWGTGNIRNQIFDFWGTGEQANLFQGNKGTGTPLGGPHYLTFSDKLPETHLLFVFGLINCVS